MATVVTSSISKTGTPDYSTPQLWEDDAPANLVTADQVWRGEIDKVTDNYTTTDVTIAGSTSDATRYKELTAKAGVSFVDHASPVLRFDASKGCSMSSGSSTVLIQEEYVRASRLQLEGTSSSGIQTGPSTALAGIQVDSVLAEAPLLPMVFRGAGVLLTNSIGIATGANTLFPIGIEGIGIELVNCLFIKPSDVAASTSTLSTTDATDTVTLTNCGLYGSANTDAGPGTITYVTCRTQDTTPPTGCTTTTYTNAAFENDLVGTHDFRLTASSDFINVGTTDARTATDIFGASRPIGASYDVGPHEFAVPVGSIGQALEIDTATSVGVLISITANIAVEIDSATTVGIDESITVTPTLEIDTAQNITVLQALGVNPTTEIDSATSVVSPFLIPINKAPPEIDTAENVTPVAVLGTGSTLEIDTAQSARPADVIGMVAALEIDSAFSVNTDQRVTALPTLEIDTAISVTSDDRVAVAPTTEIDTALPVMTDDRVSVIQTVEFDTALAVISDTRISATPASEIDTALPVSTDDRVMAGPAFEVDTALALFFLFGTTVNVLPAGEVDTAGVIAIDTGGFVFRLPDTTRIDLSLAETVIDLSY